MRTRTRRAHTKSSNGCLACKQRHIKCDERGPPCSNCVIRKAASACTYPSRRTSRPVSATSPGQLSTCSSSSSGSSGSSSSSGSSGSSGSLSDTNTAASMFANWKRDPAPIAPDPMDPLMSPIHARPWTPSPRSFSSAAEDVTTSTASILGSGFLSRTPSPDRQRLELELFHRWSSHTYRGLCILPECAGYFATSLPRSMLQHDFMLSAVLALSALDIALANVDRGREVEGRRYLQAALEYCTAATEQFRGAIGSGDTSGGDSGNDEGGGGGSGGDGTVNTAPVPVTRENIDTFTHFATLNGFFHLALPSVYGASSLPVHSGVRRSNSISSNSSSSVSNVSLSSNSGGGGGTAGKGGIISTDDPPPLIPPPDELIQSTPAISRFHSYLCMFAGSVHTASLNWEWYMSSPAGSSPRLLAAAATATDKDWEARELIDPETRAMLHRAERITRTVRVSSWRHGRAVVGDDGAGLSDDQVFWEIPSYRGAVATLAEKFAELELGRMIAPFRVMVGGSTRTGRRLVAGDDEQLQRALGGEYLVGLGSREPVALIVTIFIFVCVARTLKGRYGAMLWWVRSLAVEIIEETTTICMREIGYLEDTREVCKWARKEVGLDPL
ncbi:hypothetical protein MCOR27_001514 [Pyricularia oryzae]|uniref:Zn(2)-C6 fungal-type domain-containing protein n=3 Tax=Pyricularia TaxID=48558 RepID=A0ABQ8NSU7_PYRGI|nr:hypothetical protein MCOR01_010582 [Pyricularia oryzae]KAI6301123.1 hypothetical protein MCOR33_003304 [Pyricularia grisea]KAI6262146.1 hypothetical protein MCOR19_001655 [Pyricularia oryzae]KAI6276600.1 hypothetical protein MCOR26_005508 [Pyricularia oryzae]KAI6287066.1 hypothetical protein MCOR27_001514 [Pyricularia oryzae]